MSSNTRHGSALILTALLFAPSLATESDVDADGLDGWEDIPVPAAPPADDPAAADAPPQPQRPEVSITAAEMAALTNDDYCIYNGLCKTHTDNIEHWHYAKKRWGEGAHRAYYNSCASREDVARRIQNQHHEGDGNNRLRWEYAMQMAGDVHDILRSYYDEGEIQRDLENADMGCKATGYLFPWVAIHKHRVWWDNVNPHILKRRRALRGNHAFRNALEVFLQLRFEGRGLADIRAKYPEVLAALSAVIDPTEEQLIELRNYDRTATNSE